MRWKEAQRVSIVALYEDGISAQKGLEFCQKLSANLEPGCAISHQVWLFAELGLPALRDAAAGEAVVADLVLISARRRDTISPVLKSWMDLWLQSKGSRSPVLVLLQDGESTEESSLEEYVESAARLGHLECLSHPSFPVQKEPVPHPA